MAIAFRASSSGDLINTTGNFTITKPTGTAAADVLALVIAENPTGTGTFAPITPPAGWTTIASAVGPTAPKAWAFWSAGSNAALTFTRSGTGQDTGWTCAAFTGVDTTTAVDATGTAGTVSNAASIAANAVTVVTGQAWELIGYVDFQTGTPSATGFSVVRNGTTPNQQAALLYNPTPKSTGSTGTVTITDSAGATGQVLIAIPFALRPAGGAAPGPTFNPAALLMAL